MPATYDAAISDILASAPPTVADLRARFDRIATQLADRLKKAVLIPVAAHPFLVQDGSAPAAGQLTESQFFGLVVGKIAESLATPSTDIGTLVTSTKLMFTALEAVGNTEVLTRLLINLDDNGQYDATDVAGKTANAALATINGWTDAFTRDVDPNTWNQNTPTPPGGSQITGAATHVAAAMLGPVPRIPGSLPSSGDLGNRVHRYVQETYINEWPQHFVLIEEGEVISPGTPPTRQDLAVVINDQPWPGPAKGAIYLSGLKNPVTGRFWRPDIADLEDTLPLVPGVAPWGWFEIKHWKDFIDGFFQLSMYCAFYNGALLLANPTRWKDWAAIPGGWFPPPAMLDPSKPDQMVVITRPLPGMIIYYVFDLKKIDVSEQTYTIVMASLIALLLRSMLNQLGKIERPAYSELGWVAVIIMAVAAVIISLPAAIPAELTYAVAALLTWASAILE